MAPAGMLAGGFALNIVMTVIGMAVGMAVGAALGLARFAGGRAGDWAARATQTLQRPISLALLFGVVILVPLSFQWDGAQYPFPPWIKVALASAVPVAGFASDGLLASRLAIARREIGADLVFFAGCLRATVLVLCLSPLAGLVGAPEAVSRALALARAAPDAGGAILPLLGAASAFGITALALAGAAIWLDRRSARSRDGIVRYHDRRRRRDFQVRQTGPAQPALRNPGAD